MSDNNLEINIAYLYPDIMNVYGDAGNIIALQKRLEWRNITANIDKICLNDTINYDKYDIYFMGTGLEKQTFTVAPELLKYKEEFKNLAQNGKVMLAIGGAYQLFGNYIETSTGEKVEGLGIFDAFTRTGKKRCTGNMTVETDFLKSKMLVGFENHNSFTYLENGTKPLGKVLVGTGNNLSSKQEGAIFNNIFGTYMHGALLPKNPEFCDYILEKALQNKLNDTSYVLDSLDDKIENQTNKSLIQKIY